MFEAAGFRLEPGASKHSRQRVRRTLRPGRRAR
jgi:hypothetical protein